MLEELSEHLSSCNDCVSAAERLAPTDDMTIAIREHTPIEDDNLLCDLIDRVERLLVEQGTIAGDCSDTISVADQLQPMSNLASLQRDILDPPQSEGELGRIADYRILDVLGAGGMGLVLRAEDSHLCRQVAIKLMKLALVEREDAKLRFRREAQAAAAIEHDNIVAIYQVGEQHGVPFIAMPLLKGESLKERLERAGKLSTDEAVTMGRQIAAGIAAAHKQKLLHRDIKPENIFLEGETGRVKILDFGLARSSVDASDITHEGVVVGTPKYMSPEQAAGHEVDERSDIFSLGSVMYHMLAGRVPFEADNLTATLLAVTQANPTPLIDHVPEIDADLNQLVMQMLCKSPADRPPNSADIAQRLQNIESHLKRREMKPAEVAEKAGDSGTDRTRVAIIGAAIALAACLVAAIFLSMQTPNGRLIVEIPEDQFHATLLGQKLELVNLATDETTTITLDASNVESPLAPGQYRFAVSSDSAIHISDREFTIDKGTDRQIRIWWEPSESANVAVNRAESLTPPPFAVSPFNAEQAKQHQIRWAAYLGVPVVFTNSMGMKFQLIPPGEFMMGTPALPNGELPYNSEFPHRVSITKPFYMQETEVTQAMWVAVMKSRPWHGQENIQEFPNAAASYIDWRDAVEFAETLSRKDGLSYRLPSEAEWEWACRAGTQTTHVFGDSPAQLDDFAWFDLDSRNDDPTDDFPHAVASKLPNAWNLFDVHGNVWEWCADWYDADYYRLSPQNDPKGPERGTERAERGGSWTTPMSSVRSANRSGRDEADDNDGFRVVLSTDSVRNKQLGQ